MKHLSGKSLQSRKRQIVTRFNLSLHQRCRKVFEAFQHDGGSPSIGPWIKHAFLCSLYPEGCPSTSCAANDVEGVAGDEACICRCRVSATVEIFIGLGIWLESLWHRHIVYNHNAIKASLQASMCNETLDVGFGAIGKSEELVPLLFQGF